VWFLEEVGQGETWELGQGGHSMVPLAGSWMQLLLRTRHVAELGWCDVVWPWQLQHRSHLLLCVGSVLHGRMKSPVLANVSSMYANIIRRWLSSMH
jgi:hypothetical protein